MGLKSISPIPRRLSAPPWSRMMRESVCELTAKAIRDGIFVLIMPVTTSTEGRGLVDHDHDVGHGLLAVTRQLLVEDTHILALMPREDIVAAIHLATDVVQHIGCLLYTS